jgi:hypothetical protein
MSTRPGGKDIVWEFQSSCRMLAAGISAHGALGFHPSPRYPCHYCCNRACRTNTMHSFTTHVQVIASPLHRLRVQLHLEAAKCDAAEDSLIKV